MKLPFHEENRLCNSGLSDSWSKRARNKWWHLFNFSLETFCTTCVWTREKRPHKKFLHFEKCRMSWMIISSQLCILFHITHFTEFYINVVLLKWHWLQSVTFGIMGWRIYPIYKTFYIFWNISRVYIFWIVENTCSEVSVVLNEYLIFVWLHLKWKASRKVSIGITKAPISVWSWLARQIYNLYIM